MAFLLLALGSSKPTPEELKRRAEETKAMRAQYDDWVSKAGVVYRKIAATDKAALTDKACDGPAMLAAAKETVYLSLPTVYGPFMARFASPNKSDWRDENGPWAFLTESTFRGHFEKHAADRDASSVDGTGRMIANDWLKNRFLIVFWPNDEKANRLPLVRGHRAFDSGIFDGWLFIVDPVASTITCQKKLAIRSSEKVSSTESFTKNPQSAVQKDFEDRFEAAVKAALPDKVKSSNNMGSLLK